jgi:hypothetical protein
MLLSCSGPLSVWVLTADSLLAQSTGGEERRYRKIRLSNKSLSDAAAGVIAEALATMDEVRPTTIR